MNEKFLIYGLDGLSWSYFNKLYKNKYFNFESNQKRDLACELYSTVPSVTGVALPSFITGIVPLKLSDGYFSKMDKPYDFSKIPERAFWEYGDLKSCIINLRCTYKPRRLNGKMISGDLYTPSEDSDYTFPPSLKEKVHGFHENIDSLKYPETMLNYTEKLRQDTIKKMKVFKNLVYEEDFDISLFWDGNMDLLQHFIWGDWEEITSYIKMLLKEISEIYSKTNARNLILISDHGFDKCAEYNFNLNSWLKENNYLVVKKGFSKQKINSILYKIISKSKYLEKKAKKHSSETDDDFPFTRKYPGVNYTKTLAQLSYGWWGLELNNNILDRKEYDYIRSKLIEDLKNVQYKGKNVFKNVFTSEDLYGQSTYLSENPDIFFVTNHLFKCVVPLDNKLVTKYVPKNEKEGHHYNSPEGFFLALGEDIRNTRNIKKINIYDIAPTILHYFGIPIPKIVDGKVRKGFFREESESYQRDIQYEESKEEEKLASAINKIDL